MLAKANLNEEKKTMQKKEERHYTANTLEKVAACHDFICTNPVCGEGIKALAGRFSISSSLLRSCFKDEYGISLGRFLKEKRLEAAAYMLETEDNLTICQIAHESGYMNHSRFSYAFFSKYGIKPADYRKKHHWQQKSALSAMRANRSSDRSPMSETRT